MVVVEPPVDAAEPLGLVVAVLPDELDDANAIEPKATKSAARQANTKASGLDRFRRPLIEPPALLTLAAELTGWLDSKDSEIGSQQDSSNTH